MLRPLIAIGFLLAALVCYTKSMTLGAGVFLLLGMLFEMGFWLSLLAKKDKTKQGDSTPKI